MDPTGTIMRMAITLMRIMNTAMIIGFHLLEEHSLLLLLIISLCPTSLPHWIMKNYGRDKPGTLKMFLVMRTSLAHFTTLTLVDEQVTLFPLCLLVNEALFEKEYRNRFCASHCVKNEFSVFCSVRKCWELLNKHI
uniref:Uncharacterized protein n=1 Tax=Cacopsylla melanoneura TaxID=428564 RepID=A0A8D8TRN2_9HEMI